MADGKEDDPEEAWIEINLDETFNPYIVAVGSLAYQWNQLQESLAKVFANVATIDAQIGYAIWYSTPSDRSQREMLRAAVAASSVDRWAKKSPTAKEDLTWLVNRTNSLADNRNDAIHAPIGLVLDLEGATPGKRLKINPSYYSGNPRALKLKDKDILAEFKRYESTASTLRFFADAVANALISAQAWPQKPRLPSLGQG